MQNKRVVVTGLGAVTPLGLTFKESVRALIEGISGIGPPHKPFIDGLRCQAVAEIKGFDPLGFISRKEAQRIGLFIQYAIGASEDALEDAGLILPEDAIVVTGTSRAGILELERAISQDKPTGYTIVSTMASMLSSALAQRYRLKAEAITLSGACASGAMAVGHAFRAIKEGRAVVALCGGSDAPLTRFSIGGYERMGVLSALLPERAERPFDKDRDGFVLGEGASFMVLEELGHALKRGARIYAEVIGYCLVVGPKNQVSPSKDAEVLVIKEVLREGGLSPEELEHINLHGTGTIQGDRTEVEALEDILGKRLETIPASAVKASTGHMLSGSSAFEAGLTAWSVSSGILPPSIRSDNPDFAINISTKTRKIPVKTALSTSFGFGGVNVALLFRAFEN